MATWPESSPTPHYPLIITPRFKTVTTGFDAGNEERTRKWLFPRFDVGVAYDAITATEAQTLWNFFIARSGSYEAFYIYDLALLAGVAKTHLTHYVATGDGSTDTFDLPGRSTTAHTIYLDNESQGSGWSISATTGASSADQVEFTAAPASGQVITATFSGYLRMRVRFAQDTISQSLFVTNLYQYGMIQLTGLPAA